MLLGVGNVLRTRLRLHLKRPDVAHRVVWFSALRFRIVGLPFECTDVACIAARFRTWLAALVGVYCAVRVSNPVDGDAARQQCVRLSRSAVVL
jgi:hypothetical protein